ncbi:MAG: hypothetical protein GVY08_13295 [Bacteroidetes bacterium]|jgi:hypothetical protein|nr:hypothetical protein [Bacteroidota bacterium]
MNTTVDIDEILDSINGDRLTSDGANDHISIQGLRDREHGLRVSGKIMEQSDCISSNDQPHAKREMDKLNEESNNKLKQMKAKISLYRSAKAVSEKAASETEIGKLLNSPDVWEDIAYKILG